MHGSRHDQFSFETSSDYCSRRHLRKRHCVHFLAMYSSQQFANLADAAMSHVTTGLDSLIDGNVASGMIGRGMGLLESGTGYSGMVAERGSDPRSWWYVTSQCLWESLKKPPMHCRYLHKQEPDHRLSVLLRQPDTEAHTLCLSFSTSPPDDTDLVTRHDPNHLCMTNQKGGTCPRTRSTLRSSTTT